MVAHQRRDPPTISAAAGIDASQAITVDTAAAATATGGLHVDDNASSVPGQAQTAPPLVGSSTPVITTTVSKTAAPTNPTSAAADATPVGATSTKPIALSTVIGSCVGAFIGAAGLILLGLWFYRRYSQSLSKRRPRRGPQTRNIAGNDNRRRSHLEPWNKLEEGNDNDSTDDKWEGMYRKKEAAKETDGVAPMEKLTMFKKTPSVRTAYTHRSTDVGAFDFPSSYADFDPKLAETLRASQTNVAATAQQQSSPTYVVSTPTDQPPTISWAGSDNLANKSLVSVNTLPADMAIPTPPPTISQLHRWESAEVVQPQTAIISHHYTDSTTDTLSPPRNPFFDLKDETVGVAVAAADDEDQDGEYARGRSPAMPDYKSPKAKGKERMRYSDEGDPFDDLHSQLPKPPFAASSSSGSGSAGHTPGASISSSTSSESAKEKALQSLMAALELPEDEVRNRLRIASMQPSFISRLSSVQGDEDEEDVRKHFPMPPSERHPQP